MEYIQQEKQRLMSMDQNLLQRQQQNAQMEQQL